VQCFAAVLFWEGASRPRVEPPVADREAEGRGLATACSKGLACVFVGIAWLPLKIKQLSHAYKNHDSPEAGGDRRRA